MPSGEIVEYSYDAAGRRTREQVGEAARLFTWTPDGFLDQIISMRPGAAGDAPSMEKRVLTRDGLGQLIGINGAHFVPDTAGLGNPVVAGEVDLVNFDAGVAMVGPDGVQQWNATARIGHDISAHDPWTTMAATGSLPGGIGLDTDGSLSLDGLELTGARAYDPATRGFLSPDPLPPVVASSWAGNPYSWAGNDPLNKTDPSGLTPLTDADLLAHRSNHGGAVGWADGHELFPVTDAASVSGVLAMIAGVGGPVAAMLGGDVEGVAGVPAVDQSLGSGSTDWAQGLAATVGGGVVAGSQSALQQLNAAGLGGTTDAGLASAADCVLSSGFTDVGGLAAASSTTADGAGLGGSAAQALGGTSQMVGSDSLAPVQGQQGVQSSPAQAPFAGSGASAGGAGSHVIGDRIDAGDHFLS